MNKADVIEHIKAHPLEIPPAQPYAIEAMRAEDCMGVARLFYEVYAENYPVDDYYVPERLWAKNASGDALTLVARTADGNVAGVGALFRSSPPNPGVYELGQLIITHGYRNGRMALKFIDALVALSEATPRIEAVFGESVTNHLVTQKFCQRKNYVECGIELGLMPDGAYELEGAAMARVSCVQSIKILRDRHQALYLPEVYRDILTPVLEAFALSRELRFVSQDTPAKGPSRVDSRVFEHARVLRANIETLGEDIGEVAARLDDESRAQGLALTQVFLNAGGPGIAAATRSFREKGFYFGGFLPLWFGQDALLLQKLHVPLDVSQIQLANEPAKTLLAAIEAERRDILAGTRRP